MIRRLLPVLLLIAVGCSDSTGVDSKAATFEGHYVLQSIDGHALPYVENDAETGDQLEFISMYVLIRGDGSYTSGVALRLTSEDVSMQMAVDGDGRWARNGRTVTFTPEDDVPFTGTWDGDRTITVNDDGYILVLKK